MKKNNLRKLALATETLHDLTRPRGAGTFDAVRRDSLPEDDTCYWGCSFASCPAGGCNETVEGLPTA